MKQLPHVWHALLGLLLLAMLLPARPVALAQATVPTQRYVATTGVDSGDCASNASPCRSIGYTLSQALDGDTIYLAAGVYVENLGITRSVTLIGANRDTTVIDGDQVGSVVWVAASATVRISGLTLRNGEGTGSAILGGGVFNLGTLSLDDCIIEDSHAAGSGGGIFNAGVLSLANSIVRNNSSDLVGGGIASGGQSVNSPPERVIITNSTISGNTALSNDPQRGKGGGIATTSPTSITNSTFSGNAARAGGAIWLGDATVTLLNNTITLNTATEQIGGIYGGSPGTVTLANTVLGENQAARWPNCSGPITSLGHNLVGDTDGCTFNALASDIVSPTAALALGALQDNGGPTPTHALLSGSPALDAGSADWPGSSPGACAATDQRGIVRPQGARCDIGAYELVPNAPAARLKLEKTVSTLQVQPGATLIYTLTLRASGGRANAVLTDTLPIELSAPSDLSAGASYDATTRQIRFSGSVAPASPVVITYRTTVANTVAPGTIINNTAELSGTGERIRRSVAVVAPDTQAPFTGTLVLIYANGDSIDTNDPNNLTKEVRDLAGAVEQAARNSQIRIALLIDGPSRDDSRFYFVQPPGTQRCVDYLLPAGACRQRYVEGQTTLAWDEDTGSPASLTSFVNLAVSRYPNARNVVLSLVGHGGGWSPERLAGQPRGHKTQPGEELGGLLWDDYPGSSLSTPALGKALRASIAATGRQIDLLYLDACSMAMVEVAYEVRDSVRYLLASEQWKFATFPYSAHLTNLQASWDARKIGQEWIKNERAVLRDKGEDGSYPPFTFSLTDLRRMDMLRSELDHLAMALSNTLTSTDASTPIREAFKLTDCFDSNQDYLRSGADNYCDIASFMRQLSAQFGSASPVSEAAQRVLNVLPLAVGPDDKKYQSGDWAGQKWQWNDLGGLSIFLPLDLDHDSWKRRYYGQIAFTSGEGGWDAFLAQYWNGATPPEHPCPDCSDLPPRPVPLDPFGLVATSGYASVHLTWHTPSSGVTSYRVLRGESGAVPTTPITSAIEATRFFDTGVENDTKYCYRIAGLRDGSPVTFSEVRCATVGRTILAIPPGRGAAPGGVDTIPINLGPLPGLQIASITITLLYSSTVVAPEADLTTLLRSSEYRSTLDRSQPGVLRISSTTTVSNPTPFSGGSLFAVFLRAIGDEGAESALTLDPSGTTIVAVGNAQPLPLSLSNSAFVVSSTGFARGSLNRDSVVDNADAALAVEIASSRLRPAWWQQSAGDIDGDGQVSAADASLIAYFAANGHWPVRADGAAVEKAMKPADVLTPPIQLNLTDVGGTPGEVVTTTLRVSNLSDWAGGEFIIAYDPALVEQIEAVSTGNVSSPFELSFSDDRRGLLRIAMAGNSPVSGSGSVLQIALRIAPGAPIGAAAPLRLAEANLNDIRGRDFATSALQQNVIRGSARLHIGHVVYLPLTYR